MINPGYQVLLETEDGVQYDPWDEWGLALCSREIEAPEVQTHLVEIPGRDGYLDLTETLDGYVHYYNREVSLEFKALTRDGFFDAYGDLATITHGQKIKIYFPDESDLYFYGRCTLDKTELSNDSPWGGYITLIADCDPYRYDPTGETTTTVSLASMSTMELDLADVWDSWWSGGSLKYYQHGEEDGVSTPCRVFNEIKIDIESDLYIRNGGFHFWDTNGLGKTYWPRKSSGADWSAMSGSYTFSRDDDGKIAMTEYSSDKYAETTVTGCTFDNIYYFRIVVGGYGFYDPDGEDTDKKKATTEITATVDTVAGVTIDLEGVLNHPTPTVYSTVSGLILTDLESFWELDAGNNVCEGLLIPEGTYRLYVFLGEDMDEDDVDEDDYVSITYTGGSL